MFYKPAHMVCNLGCLIVCTLKKDKLNQLYNGLKMIKNGIAYDKRYNEKKRFARPQELVFSNEFPALDMMSAGRWEIAVIPTGLQFCICVSIVMDIFTFSLKSRTLYSLTVFLDQDKDQQEGHRNRFGICR